MDVDQRSTLRPSFLSGHLWYCNEKQLDDWMYNQEVKLGWSEFDAFLLLVSSSFDKSLLKNHPIHILLRMWKAAS